MFKRLGLLAVAGGAFVLAVVAAERTAPVVPDMKFDDVKEIAPGVFFRYSSISATDKSVPFGGSNNVWVVLKDYVVVVDANFPKQADDVLAAIKKTTDKPIKYVLDTHHHGDHAYGNCVWAKAGAKIVAHTNAARLLKTSGPKEWPEQAKDPKYVRPTDELKQADIAFDDVYVLDDGTRRVEFRHFGHSHTRGDAVCYLPKEKILCTGDACVNGSFNFMGHSNSATWVTCLEKMKALDIDLICPGHGKVTTKDLLDTQARYFRELRAEVKKGIDAKKSADDIAAGLDMGWYKEWTGKAARENGDNVKHVFDELSGKIDHDRIGMTPAPVGYGPAERRAAELPGVLRGPAGE